MTAAIAILAFGAGCFYLGRRSRRPTIDDLASAIAEAIKE
jgi:hypothetical protein